VTETIFELRPVPRHVFVAIDFETANYSADSACALGLVRVEDGIVTDELALPIRPPERWFVPRFTALHGIAWEHVAEAPDFAGHYPAIARFAAGAEFLAAHNAGFDRNVLRATAARYGLPPLRKHFVCTVKLARAAWNIHPTRLPNVCLTLGIDLARHHDALADARACAAIVARAMADAPHLIDQSRM